MLKISTDINCLKCLLKLYTSNHLYFFFVITFSLFLNVGDKNYDYDDDPMNVEWDVQQFMLMIFTMKWNEQYTNKTNQ